MCWHPGDPELDIPKPSALKELDGLGDDVINAMDTVEIDRRIDDIANQIAHAYVKKAANDFEECVNLISMVLSVTGSSMGGRVGARFVAKSQQAAQRAAHEVYQNDFNGDL